MTELFIYGTLRDIPLLEIVLGRPAEGIDRVPAELCDHAVHRAEGESFPLIRSEPGAVAEGLLLRGLTGKDMARLHFYEGGFDYDSAERKVRLQDGSVRPALVFFPSPGRWRTGPRWSLAEWVRDWGALSRRAAREVMDWYGRKSAPLVARSFYALRIRAAAELRAAARPADPVRDPARDVVVHDQRRVYMNFFALDEMEVQFRQNDGQLSPVLNRCAIRVGDAAIVLPYDPVRDEVLLIEQFRAAVHMAGDPAPWVWEAPAGLIDPGETPEQAALRELREEARVDVIRLEKVAAAYSSTGSSTEFSHIFVGLADLSAASGTVAGLESEGEDIRSQVLPFAEFIDRIDAGAYRNLHLVTAGNWLARHRDRLRADGLSA